jgi:hypothetical protein
MGVPGSGGVCQGRSSVVEPVKYIFLLSVKFDFALSCHRWQDKAYMEPAIISKVLITLGSILTGEATRHHVLGVSYGDRARVHHGSHHG